MAGPRGEAFKCQPAPGGRRRARRAGLPHQPVEAQISRDWCRDTIPQGYLHIRPCLLWDSISGLSTATPSDWLTCSPVSSPVSLSTEEGVRGLEGERHHSGNQVGHAHLDLGVSPSLELPDTALEPNTRAFWSSLTPPSFICVSYTLRGSGVGELWPMSYM